MTLVR
jgi:hypothetical protein